MTDSKIYRIADGHSFLNSCNIKSENQVWLSLQLPLIRIAFVLIIA
jgi:hypothetical protein